MESQDIATTDNILSIVLPATRTVRKDFQLGEVKVSPTTRTITGPGGSVSIEPRVMQVLLELVQARGAVVTRDQLIVCCWGGTIVGDDAINRTISEIRKVARTVGDGSFGVETISKSGYRLTGLVAQPPAVPQPDAAIALDGEKRAEPLSRRVVIGAGVATVSGFAVWRLWPDRDAAHAHDLVASAQQALREEMPNSGTVGVGLLRQAAALQPHDAAILGKLAVAWCLASEFAEPGHKGPAVLACQDAARRALAVKADQPDALAALAMLQPEYGDWLAAEKRLRAVLAIEPSNEFALAALGVVLQGVGRSRESAAITLSLAARFPLAPRYRYRRSYALWNLGRLGEADRNIDNALEIWPRHPAIWFAKLWIFAMTGRAPIALAMLDDVTGRPLAMTPVDIAELRVSMRALSTRAPADIRAALDTNLAAVMKGPSSAVYAIMVLTQLGQMDAAFEVARGYLLRRGPYAGQLHQPAETTPVPDERHRKTLMLFIRATAPLRADSRFLPLCEDMGLAAYWRAARVRPDFLMTKP